MPITQADAITIMELIRFKMGNGVDQSKDDRKLVEKLVKAFPEIERTYRHIILYRKD